MDRNAKIDKRIFLLQTSFRRFYTFDDVCPFIRAENTHCQVHVNGVNYANSPFDPASEWLTGEFGLYSKFDRFLLTI